MNGHLNIKVKFVDEDGYQLGQKASKIKDGYIKLTDEQEELLINLGMDLAIKKSDTNNKPI